MPPPDSTHIPGVTWPPPPLIDLLIDSLAGMNGFIDPVSVLHDDRPEFLFPEWQMFLFVIAGPGFSYYLLKPLRSYTDQHLSTGLSKKANMLLEHNSVKYHDWLNKFNPYYHSLRSALKEVFLYRVAVFMQSKKFKFHSLPEEEYLPVLISGAAVQLTFGVQKFSMDFFQVIHVIPKEYNLLIDYETCNGHVSKSGIYIAWNHFLEGYNNYTDSINVGLHEMAHAVSFDVFLGEQDDHDFQYRKRLEMFVETGRPVFRAMRQGSSHLLDEYGATNFDEFRAVCIETFFENTAAFKKNEPILYQAVCNLLNQDPLTDKKIIDPALAGLKV